MNLNPDLNPDSTELPTPEPCHFCPECHEWCCTACHRPTEITIGTTSLCQLCWEERNGPVDIPMTPHLLAWVQEVLGIQTDLGRDPETGLYLIPNAQEETDR